MSAFSIVDLRTETLKNPLGLGERAPRLSWKMRSAGRNLVQVSRRILAASSEAALRAGKADLWDGGEEATSASTQVEWKGRPLASRQRVWWKVTVRASNGETVDSEPAFFEMGLLERGDWNAKWIGSPFGGSVVDCPPVTLLRNRFSFAGKIAKARLYATALGLYEAEINGRRVGEDVFTPGWTDTDKRVSVQVYDVTSLLRSGENVWGAFLADGWFSGYVGWDQKKGREDRGRFNRFFAQLEIEGEDGVRKIFATDDKWRWSQGAIHSSDFQMGERYDARDERPGWSEPSDAGMDEGKDWFPVAVSPDSGINLTAQQHPPVRRTAVLPATRVDPFAPGGPAEVSGSAPAWARDAFLYDFGQNLSGRVRFRLSAPRGTMIRMRHGEMLQADGSLYVENLRGPLAVDTYVFKGEGEEVFEPRFTFHGFRYLEVSGLPSAPPASAFEAVVLRSETEETGTWGCGDPLVSRLQKNIQWGQDGNFLEVPTDCPQRNERLGWTGDAQVFIRTACFNRDVASFFTKWLTDLSDAQGETGRIPMVAPNPTFLKDRLDGGPAWADAFVICPWTIFRQYGDLRLAERHHESLKRFVDSLAADAIGLVRSHPDFKGFHGFGDWLSLDVKNNDSFGSTPKDLIGTAFFSYSARLLSELSAALGRKDDETRYSALARDVAKVFHKRFFPEGEEPTVRTQTGYLLALHFRLVPEARRKDLVARLVADIRGRGVHLSTGFVGTPYLALVLDAEGETGLAYELLLRKEFPSWLFPITQGATTIWERWDGWTQEKGFQSPGMNSFNHYAYGAIGAWLYTGVSGIDTHPGHVGYEKILLRPRPARALGWAKASYESVRGTVRSDWRYEGDLWLWEIEIPANASAEVVVPITTESEVRMDGAAVPSERLASRNEGEARLELGSGTWRFEVSRPRSFRGA